MKTLISVIGQLKISKLKPQSGFSLFEIVVVISLISVLSYFISLSPFFINKEKNVKSLDEKIKLIEKEAKIKLRAKNFPKQLIDNQKKQKGVEV